MGKVWTFGDSLTERYNPIFKWSRDYIEWKGYVPKVYGNFVSEMLNYKLENLGKAGCDNYTIFETFCKNYSKMQDEDVIIIGWTSVGRFRLATKHNNWVTLNPNFDNYLKDIENISKNTIDEIFINRTNSKYIDEVNDWIDFINLICKDKKVIHWSTIHGPGELNTHHFFEMQRIDAETNGLIDDAHFSEKGQHHLALELIDVLINKQKIIKSNKLI